MKKLTVDVAERVFAMRIAGALQDLVEPPPDALSVFEERQPGNTPPAWRVEAIFAEQRDASALEQDLGALLGESIPAFTVTDVPNLNWVALSQAALPPVKAQRFTVHGSHDRERVPQGPNAILIDAGEAFGTAHHATTYGCLVALDRLAHERSFHDILDLGCGSGVLAIAAARAWPKALISGVDIDRQSITVARDNATANGAGHRIVFRCGAGVNEPLIRRRGPFDLVLANILAAPLIRLARDLRRTVKPAGVLVLSGILNREAPAVTAAYLGQDFTLRTHTRHDGWSALTLAKRP